MVCMIFTLSDLVLIMSVCVASICRRITNNLPDQLIFYVTLVMKFFILCIVALLSVVSSLSVCQAGEEALLGEYVKDVENTMDGVAVYSNANDMAFFRNKGFWYLGNLGPWPPETHYRCVKVKVVTIKVKHLLSQLKVQYGVHLRCLVANLFPSLLKEHARQAMNYKSYINGLESA